MMKSKREAVDLICRAEAPARGGRVWLMRMRVVRGGEEVESFCHPMQGRPEVMTCREWEREKARARSRCVDKLREARERRGED